MNMLARLNELKTTTRQLLSNRIVLGFIFLAGAFWVGQLVLPVAYRDPIIIAARCLIIVGLVMTAVSYLSAAIKVLAQGRTDGTTELLVGMVVFRLAFAASSLYTVVWILADRPVAWTSHPLLIFILMWQLVGVGMEFKAPITEGGGFGDRSRAILVVGIIFALVVAFALGRVTTPLLPSPGLLQDAYPNCPKDRPVYGNITRQGDKIYHLPDGPYYQLTRPERCFASAEEAEAAGFRAPG